MRVVNCKTMAFGSKVVVLFAALLMAGNGQCVTACAFDHCAPVSAPTSRCHHKGNLGNKTPAAPACSHEAPAADTSAKTVVVQAMDGLISSVVDAVIVVNPPQRFSYLRIDPDLSPPASSLSLISILRI
jgi:hypothetical protein